MPRSKGGQGLRTVKIEYIATKITSAVRLHGNEDPALGMVGEFEEQRQGRGVGPFLKKRLSLWRSLGWC